jgi:hypothetical protein
MKISSVSDFRDHAARLTPDEPLLITRHGRLTGVFLPWTDETLPSDLKRELFFALSAHLGRQLKKSGTTEEDIVADVDAWKKKRRAARRRH